MKAAEFDARMEQIAREYPLGLTLLISMIGWPPAPPEDMPDETIEGHLVTVKDVCLTLELRTITL